MSVDQVALLKDLRKQVTALENDLRERTESEPEYRAALSAEYRKAMDAGRTAATYGPWRDERVTQAAVAWVLATVFVRFCEDNRLVPEARIAGPGDRLAEADENHRRFFRDHPEKNDRDWLLASFGYLAEANDTVKGLFDPDHNPLWELSPSYEAATELLRFWRRTGPDGEIVHDFTDDTGTLDTRFLGDLYQDLSDHAKKTYALLQTPRFVEEFILDLTLEPAIEEFGLEPVWRYRPPGWPGETGPEGEIRGLRTIDPACGSGHFLLGIFDRLLGKWKDHAPGMEPWERIRHVLESIHGCDKNPFAAAIARFRLLIAALNAAGETRLNGAPIFPLNIAVGDSLLHGRGAIGRQTMLDGEEDEAFQYSTEDIDDFVNRCDLLGTGSYHVVVGNPPYITVKDKQENLNYRRYSAAAGKYALSVPFAQRIFDLALPEDKIRNDVGFTGQITSNSFMKREFGKKLIEDFFRKRDLTHVIDTSGAYIPGHGTPTVILAGRNRHPRQEMPIRAVLGIRGEPGVPEHAETGKVWTAIERQSKDAGSESEWVTVTDLDRLTFAYHPWSLGGGGAGDMLDHIEGAAKLRLKEEVSALGISAVTGEDDLYLLPFNGASKRLGIAAVRPMVLGDDIRDFRVRTRLGAIWVYDDDLKKLSLDEIGSTARFLWPFRAAISQRKRFGRPMLERGMFWHEWQELYPAKLRTPMSITYAEVATHNHFVLARGGSVFNRTAPVIKLPGEVTEDEHLALLGLLNSSTACFWLKQVSHDKGIRGEGGGFTSSDWERFYQFGATKLEKFPVPSVQPLEWGKRLDALAYEYGDRDPRSMTEVLTPSRDLLAGAREMQMKVRRRMIAGQEELDWTVYGSYGLLTKGELADVVLPEDIEPPEVKLGERAFEIVLARRIAMGETDDEWFRRHGSAPVTEIPERWPEAYKRVVQARIDLIEKRPKGVGLLERPEYKRRWSEEPWEKREKVALRAWILDRCEREALWYTHRDGVRHPRTLTVAQLADQFRQDEEMQSVAALYAADHMDARDLPLVTVLEEVIADQHVPYLAALRYSETGLRKRAEWENVWKLQREEDQKGTSLDIAVPPKYAPKDFLKTSYWSQRGKLDVPKERFISYPGAAPDADSTLLLGWAGWDHLDQAQALVNLVNDRSGDAGWEAERLAPLLAGLLELLPWLHQWHGQYDDEWGAEPAKDMQGFLDSRRTAFELSEDALRTWKPEKKRRGRAES